MPRTKEDERRRAKLYTTIQLDDMEYAQLATYASLRGLSMGQVIRLWIRDLPAVTDETKERWMQYRRRSGHERPLPSLQELEWQATQKPSNTVEDELLAREEAALKAWRQLNEDAGKPPEVVETISRIFDRPPRESENGPVPQAAPPAGELAGELTDLPLTAAQREDLERKRANEKKAKETEL